MSVQFIEIPHLRDGNKEVQPGKLDDPLDHALLIGPADQTEVMIKQVMAQQMLERRRQLPIPGADDLTDAHGRVVVRNPLGNGVEETECPHMPFQKGLGAFPRKGHDKGSIRMGQHHHKERRLPQDTVHVHQRMTEIHLGLPRSMNQRHEHLPPLALQIPNRLLDDGIPARKAVFSTKPFPDPLGCVTLLFGQRLVLL